jgi:hypothetical protein
MRQLGFSEDEGMKRPETPFPNLMALTVGPNLKKQPVMPTKLRYD